MGNGDTRDTRINRSKRLVARVEEERTMNESHDYFIAARYRNKEQVLALASALRAQGKLVYTFVESNASRKHVGELDADAEQSMRMFESIPNWRDDPRVREVFETDLAALQNSKAVILLLPAGKSAHIEAGIAYGLGKHIVCIGPVEKMESLYLIFDETYPTVAEFLKSL